MNQDDNRKQQAHCAVPAMPTGEAPTTGAAFETIGRGIDMLFADRVALNAAVAVLDAVVRDRQPSAKAGRHRSKRRRRAKRKRARRGE